ncbi:MAG: helix-turn-helix domain-containing protein [Bacteroidetes bacterium]|nr:helix-turn-helix domain-containing protein [Bacteroidota bacterium]
MSDDRIIYRGEWQFSILKKFVCNSNLSRNARFLFIVLKSYANDTKKECFPSRELLCQIMNCTQKSLSKYMAELQKKGFLQITRERNEDGEFLHNVYEIIENAQNLPCENISSGKIEDLTNVPFTYMVNSPTNKNPYINIYSFWNEQKIIVHKNLTDKTKRKIFTALKTYTEEEILQSITNYSTIVNGKGYYFNYRWTLEDFLSRGLEKFLGDVEIIKENYRDKRVAGIITAQTKETVNSEEVTYV